MFLEKVFKFARTAVETVQKVISRQPPTPKLSWNEAQEKLQERIMNEIGESMRQALEDAGRASWAPNVGESLPGERISDDLLAWKDYSLEERYVARVEFVYTDENGNRISRVKTYTFNEPMNYQEITQEAGETLGELYEEEGETLSEVNLLTVEGNMNAI